MDQVFTSWLAIVPACLATVASLAAVCCLRQGKYRNLALTPWQNRLLLGGTLGVLLFAAWWFGLREPLPDLPNGAQSEFYGEFYRFAQRVPPSSGVLDESGQEEVTVGDRLPAFRAQGWLNGPLVLPAESAAGVTVIDIWNEICPVCDAAAPGLVQIAKKWEQKGVNFIGVTTRNRNQAEAFLGAHRIRWPHGLWGRKPAMRRTAGFYCRSQESHSLA